MKNVKTVETRQINTPMAKQDALAGTLQDEALDRPVGGISVQCGCFPFCFSMSPGSPN